MPIIFTVDHERQLVHSIAIGPVTFEDVRAHTSQELHWRALSYPELVDARGAGSQFASSEASRLLDVLRPLAAHTHLGRTAVLVASDEAFATMSMIEKLVAEFCEMKPFRDETEARKWLASKSTAAAP